MLRFPLQAMFTARIADKCGRPSCSVGAWREDVCRLPGRDPRMV